jgi:hypothetical protein
MERASRRRLSGASVSYLADDTTDNFALDDSAGWVGPDPEATVRERGRTVLADERGEVEIPTSAAAWLVCGRAKDLFGWVRLEPHMAGEQELLLEPQRDLTVRVVDDLGAACAGIRVSLCRGPQHPNGWERVTDASGNVTIRNLASVVRGAFLDEEHAVEVHAEFPTQPAIAQWIDPWHPPDGPVQLVLPTYGRLRLHVVDDAGRPLHLSGTASLCTVLATGIEHDPKQSRFWAKVPFDDADAIEAAVAVGGEFDVSVTFDVDGGASGRVAGPRARGDIVPAQIRVDTDVSLFTGRIVDERAIPLARSSLRLEKRSLSNGTIAWIGDSLHTDSEGRFVIVRSGDMAWIVERAPARGRRAAMLDFRTLADSSAHDLGDVRLSSVAPLVYGRLEDENGRPIAGGSVSLMLKQSPTDPVPVNCGSDYPTDLTGEFAIYGPCVDGAYSLWGYTEGDRHRSRPPVETFSCREPPHEHIVRLETLGAVEGFALLDEGRNPDEFELRLGIDSDDYAHAIGFVSGGAYRFHIRGVEPGKYALAVVERDGKASVLHIDGIIVNAGEVTHDPRLEPLDLRHVFPHPVKHDIVLPVVDASGRSVPFGITCFWEDAQSAYRERWADGQVHIPSSGVIAVDVSAPGHRVAHVDAAEFGKPVALGAACDVAIGLERPKELVDRGIKLIAILQPLDESVGRHSMREILHGTKPSAPFDELGEAHFHLALPGRFELMVKLIQPDPSTGEIKNAWLIHVDEGSRHIEVSDRDGPQRFDVRLDPSELRNLLDALHGARTDR